MILTVQILDFSGMENDLRIAMLGSTSLWWFSSTPQFWKFKSTCIISKIAFWTNFLFNYDNAIFGSYNLWKRKMRFFLIKIIIIPRETCKKSVFCPYTCCDVQKERADTKCMLRRSEHEASTVRSVFVEKSIFHGSLGNYDDFY